MKKVVLLTIFWIVLFLPKLVLAETIVSLSDCYINENKIWAVSGSPYLVNCHIQIPENVTLTIEAGTEVKMQNGTKFDIYGTLNVLGTETNKVIFTVQNEESSRWGGLVFYENSKGNFDYADMKYAELMIYNMGGIVDIKNSSIIKNYSVAIYAKSGTTNIENMLIDKSVVGVIFQQGYFYIKNSTISNTTSSGLIAESFSSTLVASNNHFINNQDRNYIDLKVNYDLQNNTFENNLTDAWVISGSLTGQKVFSDTISTNGIVIEPGGVLTISPGTVIKGQDDSYITNKGTLNMNGTKENPIIFTSIDSQTKTAGIRTEAGGTTNISYTFIKYAGEYQSLDYWNWARSALLNNGGNITADNVQISDTYHTGIYHNAGKTEINNLTISGELDASIRYYSGDLKINNSSVIPSYANYIFENLSNLGTPDLRNNWWGYPEGPYHQTQNTTGNTNFRLSGDVLFIPFLTEPPKEKRVINPVIIIPGIMGSALKKGEWQIDPTFHVYDNLIETLEANGYIEGTDLFPFAYDWKKSNTETAVKLKEKIEEIKGICNCNKIDIVAHSMGGLVARQYAQSENYGNDIDQLIFLGTPHRGSPKDYLVWEGGEFENNLQSRYVKSYYEKEAKHLGYKTIFDYIHNWPIYSVQELLPTYSYLKSATTSQMLNYPIGYPQNDFLENLNQGLVGFLQSDIDITNIIGNIGNNTISTIRITDSNKLPLWQHGYPENYDNSGNKGLEMGIGDGTVPEYSSNLSELLNLEISNSHIDLPTEAEEEIYKELTNKDVGTTIKKSIPLRILYAKIFSPADIVVIAPDGKRVGKNFQTGEEYNEIPGAFYSGFDTDDEYITIPDPIDGEYKIEVQGTGSGKYEVAVSNISENTVSESNFTGQTSPQLQSELLFDINAETISEITPEDTDSPTITITSPEKKDYLRYEKIDITVTSVDISGIATTTLLINNKFFISSDKYDPFFGKLGTTTLFATSTDNVGNTATTSVSFRVIANASSTISDINRAYDLKWIKDKKTRDSLIKQVEAIVKFQKKIDIREEKLPNGKNKQVKIERFEKVIDKILAKLLALELDLLLKKKTITQDAHKILKEDLNWIINNY